MKNKIFITGCAKTGTTLVRRLFNAFDLKVYNKEEISLDNFIKSDYEVGKRTFKDVFSNILSPQEISHQLNLIEKNNIKIINITRNKVDTLKSSNGWVEENRYEACINQASIHSKYIAYSLDYSDLISSPDTIQTDLSQIFNLQITHKWSDFPDWFNKSEEPKGGNWDTEEYSLRKVGAPK